MRPGIKIIGIVLLSFFSIACTSTSNASLRNMTQQLEQEKGLNTPFFFERYSWLLYREGRYIESVRFHLLAASSALQEQGEDYQSFAMRNMVEAHLLLEDIQVETLDAPASGKVQEPFGKELTFRVTFRDEPFVDIPLTISQQYQDPGGKNLNSTSVLTSDEGGTVSVLPHTPVATGVFAVSATLAFDTLVGAEISDIPIADEVRKPMEETLSRIVESVSIPVDSDAKEHALLVMVTDIDVAGSLIEESNTTDGIVSTLQEAGFDVSFFFPSMVLDRKAALDIAQNLYGETVVRVLFGSTAIVRFEELQEGYSVDVRAQIEIVDIQNGRVLLTVDKSQRSNGGNSSSTVVNSFRVVGRRVAEEVLRGLP